MRSYTRLLVGLFLGLIAIIAATILIVDPYGLLNGPRIAGFNAEKTRRNEDGRRVAVGQEVLTGRHGTLLFGNSRAVDGFPDLSAQDWPGGLFNAGMRGASAFEIARAAVLAGRSKELRCVVFALDYSTFSINVKAKATYWISALPDGDAPLAMARISLSPHAFLRAIQTVQDNAAGKPPEDRWPSVYQAGEQLRRTEKGARGFLGVYRGFEYDPARLDFLMQTADALAARGVQVIGLIDPLHAWHEEALIQAGEQEDEARWLADLTNAFAKLRRYKANAPCAADPAGGVLWDFSGFQMAPYSFPPAPDATAPQPFFYEAAHFTPDVGRAALLRIVDTAPSPAFALGFGEELTPQTLPGRAARVEARRQAWLTNDPATAALEARFAEWRKTDGPEQRGPRLILSRDDWQALERDIRRMRPIEKTPKATP